jgi:ribosomal protein S12 methylthiotransferase accessory factor
MSDAEPSKRPIVFLGPSLPLDHAKGTLPHADYRPPIKRGDLDAIAPGSIVGIIDGVFGQTLAISPGEIGEALKRGVTVFGAASMGALRAAEVRGVVGVGRIFEMYRTGAIERDDEVALIFDPDTYTPLTEPLVNVRYAVSRLVRSKTLDRSNGDALLEAAANLHFTERTYSNIFRHSTLRDKIDSKDLIRLLRTFDLKRDDAQTLLETISSMRSPASAEARTIAVDELAEGETGQQVHDHEGADAEVLVWEYGDKVRLRELLQFLQFTGAFETYARRAVGRFAVAGVPLHGDLDPEIDANEAQSILDATRAEWGWESPEEAHVTMRDLGLGLMDLGESLEAEASTIQLLRALKKAPTEAFLRALRSELWLNDLSMKREMLRLGAVKFLASRGAAAGPPTEGELDEARRCICRLRWTMQWSAVRSELVSHGVSDSELAKFVCGLALARRAGRPLIDAMNPRSEPGPPTPRGDRWRALGLGFHTCIKAEDSARFSLGMEEASKRANDIAEKLGIRRIGLVGELATLGVHVAHAFGNRTGWSATFASGKSETPEGAKVGSVMEEAEVVAQSEFHAVESVSISFATGAGGLALVDPGALELPFDSGYSETLEIGWSECFDLVSCRKVLVPSAAIVNGRVANDIYYSPRHGAKVFSTNGLGSGFSLAEAAVHAGAECIERHAMRLAELEIDNPGGLGGRAFWFVDNDSLTETPKRIVEKYRQAGMCVRILNITSEIAVPAFWVKIFEDPFVEEGAMANDGYACHPDRDVAVTMALLEAAQTRIGAIAGAREDLSLKARSLGRHERPKTLPRQSQLFWYSNDRPIRPLQETRGLSSRDILTELEWMIDRVQDAGYREFLLVDYTTDRILPAHAVRVLIPGVEGINPFHTGARARAASIRDLLPRPAAAKSSIAMTRGV